MMNPKTENTLPSQLTHLLPSNKFYPPHINTEQALIRPHLLDKPFSPQGTTHKIIVIEAQAGQGKTTLAYQIVARYGKPFLWYQIGKEDSDPFLLLISMLDCIKLNFSSFTSPQLDRMLNQGEITVKELPLCINILLQDIRTSIKDELFIVFDDLHLLHNADTTNSLLSQIFDTAPPQLHFILISRHPLTLKSKVLRNKSSVLFFSTADLALAYDEIETLFNTICKHAISIEDAKKLESRTNGWIMGVVLTAHALNSGKTLDKQAQFSQKNRFLCQKSTLSYFEDEIFTQIPLHLHTAFLQLSFLDEIHQEIAIIITQKENITDVLRQYAEDNFFIYNLDQEGTVFRFHHLFQEFLQKKAFQFFGEAPIRTLRSRIAAFFLEKGMIDKSLTYYLLAKEYDAMDEILHVHGLNLMAQNRTITILALLQTIPQETITTHGWLVLFSGILGEAIHPAHILEQLQIAQEIFVKTGEELGELLSLSQILYFHFVVSGQYNLGAQLLVRTEELLLRQLQHLSPQIQIMARRNLAAGYCFFSANMNKAREHIAHAHNLAIQHAIPNFLAATLFIETYIELHMGNRRILQHKIEESHTLINSPLVSMNNKFTLRVMLLCSLTMYGDIDNFFRQQNIVQHFVAEDIVKQTVAGSFFSLWNGFSLISLGKTKEALASVNKGISLSTTSLSPHMQSQLLQLSAYAYALEGKTEEAFRQIAIATDLRIQAGGPFYQAFNHILAAAIYGRCHQKALAHKYFSSGIKLADKISSPYLIVLGHMQRAYCKLLHTTENEALDDLQTGLRVMQENGYDYFWTCDRNLAINLLQCAVKHDIYRDFCQNIAERRLQQSIQNDGKTLPILRINLLEGFSIFLGNTRKLGAENLTPSQREILGIVLANNAKKIPLERIELFFWPDSSPKQARQKFDTLLRRLRTTMTSYLGLDAAYYISINKGILNLDYVTSDIEEFSILCKKGLKHYKRQEYWQAENFLYKGLALWKGNLPSDYLKNDLALECENILLNSHEQSALALAQILTRTGRDEEAITTLSQAMTLHSTSEEIVLALCSIFSLNHKPLKVKETLNRYKQTLTLAEYDKNEIREIIEDISCKIAQTSTTTEGFF